MSKSHSFRAYFPLKTDFAEDDMRHVLRICRERGFSACGPLSESEVVQHMLSSKCRDTYSHICVWKGNQSLDVDISCRYGAERVPSIAFAVTRSLLWEGTPDREDMSRDLQSLFLGMCSELDARYGHFYSNLTAEEVDDLSRVLTAVVAGKAPHWLFWLNYFSADYFRTLKAPALTMPSGCIREVDKKGVAIILSEHPWISPGGPVEWRKGTWKAV